MKRLAILLAALSAASAHSDVVGAHLVTAHSAPGFRNTNPGLYYRADNGLTAGVLRNSEGGASAYVGVTLGDEIAITLGTITGYRCAPVLPLASPSVRLGNFRLAYLPKVTAAGAHALHLTFEVKL